MLVPMVRPNYQAPVTPLSLHANEELQWLHIYDRSCHWEWESDGAPEGYVANPP